MKRLTKRQRKAARKAARMKSTKPKQSKYALKVRAREHYLDAGGTWQGWIARRQRKDA